MTRKLSLFSRAMLGLLFAAVAMVATTASLASDLLITGVFDGPSRGIELFAKADIADLSIYGLERTANGANLSQQEYTFPARSVPAGSYLYVTGDEAEFLSFFGFVADFRTSTDVVTLSGDDGVVLYRNGSPVDLFGEPGVDGTNEPWDYRDGWAYRQSDTGPDGTTFTLSNWTFSGTDVFDGLSSNSAATPPFPARTYMSSEVSPVSPLEYLVFNEVLPDPNSSTSNVDTDGNGQAETTDEFIELYNTSSASLDISGLQFWDSGANLTFTVPPNTVLGPNGFLVLVGSVNGGSLPAVETGSLAYATDIGTLSLTNGGDNLVVYDPTTDAFIQGVYNGDAIDSPPASYVGFSATATRIGSVQNLGLDLDGTSIALDPDGDTTNPVLHNSIGDLSRAASPGTSNPALIDVSLISAIQGSGDTSPLLDLRVTIEGIVVGDFQTNVGIHGNLGGFFVQEEDVDQDGDSATSEGIFVFAFDAQLADVSPGDLVRVVGIVAESFEFTVINEVSEVTILSNGNPLPTPATVNLPADLEAFEGMLVHFPAALTVTEMFNLDRFGEMKLIAGERPFQWTELNAPSVQGFEAHIADIEARSITLDDGQTVQNPDPIIYPDGELDSSDVLRMGDTVTGLRGVLQYSFNEFRVHPTDTAPAFVSANPRPTGPPEVGGTLKVAAFNLRNFFLTLDDRITFCGPGFTFSCRGADTQDEFDRQLAKIIAGLGRLDADIVGLVELENTPGVAVLQTLVDALNAEVGAGTYSFVDSGSYGGDTIRQGLIYKPSSVTPIGTPAILDNSFDSAYNDSLNRPTLLQTFEEVANGERFSVAAIHLKSKGSGCSDPGDLDAGDGQSRCNQARTNAMQVLVDWLGTDPSDSGDEDFLLVGDFNAYSMEDPITLLKQAGYTPAALDYSFVFDGQRGSLDHIFTSEGLTSRVTGAGAWHTNADEPDAIDYDLSFGRPPNIYQPNEFRSSDHDPIVVGLDFSPPPPGPPAAPVIERIDSDGSSLFLFVSIGDTGNAPIARFDASCSDGTQTLSGSGPGPRIDVPGAIVGRTYSCTVTATNTGGFTSADSQSSAPVLVEESITGLPVWLLFVGNEGRR